MISSLTEIAPRCFRTAGLFIHHICTFKTFSCFVLEAYSSAVRICFVDDTLETAVHIADTGG